MRMRSAPWMIVALTLLSGCIKAANPGLKPRQTGLPLAAAEAAEAADSAMILVNDEKQQKLYRGLAEPGLTYAGKALAFTHSFNTTFWADRTSRNVECIWLREGAGAHCAAVCARGGCALPGSGGAGLYWQGDGDSQGVSRGYWRQPLRACSRDNIPRGNRDRPVLVTGGALRRRYRAFACRF